MSVPPVPRRAGASLAERAATTAELERERAQETRHQQQPEPSGRSAEPRHCWVSGLPAAPGRWPGLLTEWRHQDGRWEGLVTYAVRDGSSTVLIQSWVPGEHLRPT